MSDPQQKIFDEAEAHQSRHHAGLGFDAAAPAPPPAAAPAPAAPLTAAQQAAAIAARLSAQFGASTARPALPAEYAVVPAPAPAPPAVAAMSSMPTQAEVDAISDPVAKARAIAARLNAASGLGKRRAEDEPGSAWSKGEDGKKKKKLYVPVERNPSMNWLALLVGPKGSNLKRMETESGAKLLIRGKGGSREGSQHTAMPDDNEPMHVQIFADTDESIAKAEQLLNEIMLNPENATRLQAEQMREAGVPSAASAGGTGYGGGAGGGMGPDSFGVPTSIVGFIIGRGGENIRDIQSRTGTHVQIQRETEMAPGATERMISITGPPAGVIQARQQIMTMVESRRAELNRDAGVPTAPSAGGAMTASGVIELRVPVPDERVGVVIGRGGATIRAIEAKTGARVQVPREADAGNPTVRTICITAPSHAAADAAQTEIYATLSDTDHVARENMHQMKIPNDRAGMIIGRGGANIRELQAKTGTRIQLPTEPEPGSMPPVRTLTISGPPAGIEVARQEIEAIINAPPGTVHVSRDGPSIAAAMAASGGAGGAYGGAYGGAMGGYGAAPGAYGGGYAPAYGGAYGGYGGGGAPGYAQAAPADPWASYYAAAAAAAAAPQASAPAPAPAADPAAAGQSNEAAWAAYYQQYYAYYGTYPPQMGQPAADGSAPQQQQQQAPQ